MKVLLSKAQIVAFLSPLITVISGALAAFLLVHVHLLGIFHATQSQTAEVIASGIVFAVTTGLTWLSHHYRWLPMTATAFRTGTPVSPPSQILVLLQPVIAVVAGALAAWVFVHFHVLGFLHVTESQTTQVIASGIVFAVTAGVTWAAHHFHWLPLALKAVAPPQHATSSSHYVGAPDGTASSSGVQIVSTGSTMQSAPPAPMSKARKPKPKPEGPKV